MSTSVLYMSMSLDGYIAGPNDEVGNPGGSGFMRLHEWFATPGGEFFRPDGEAGQLIDEINATGAVLGDGVLRSRPITGKVIIMVSPSSWSVTGRPVPRWPTIRW